MSDKEKLEDYLKNRIASLESQLDHPECGNPLKVDHKLEACTEMLNYLTAQPTDKEGQNDEG